MNVGTNVATNSSWMLGSPQWELVQRRVGSVGLGSPPCPAFPHSASLCLWSEPNGKCLCLPDSSYLFHWPFGQLCERPEGLPSLSARSLPGSAIAKSRFQLMSMDSDVSAASSGPCRHLLGVRSWGVFELHQSHFTLGPILSTSPCSVSPGPMGNQSAES